MSAVATGGHAPHVVVHERLPTFDTATLATMAAWRDAHGAREAARLEFQRALTPSAKAIATAKVDRASVKIRELRAAVDESLRQEALDR